MERYQAKKVVIIGGTSGMGLATAKMLLDGGARVLVTGRSKEGLEKNTETDVKRAVLFGRPLSQLCLRSRLLECLGQFVVSRLGSAAWPSRLMWSNNG